MGTTFVVLLFGAHCACSVNILGLAGLCTGQYIQSVFHGHVFVVLGTREGIGGFAAIFDLCCLLSLVFCHRQIGVKDCRF